MQCGVVQDVGINNSGYVEEKRDVPRHNSLTSRGRLTKRWPNI
jgi:hypothetical protein